MADTASDTTAPLPAKEVVYCGICSLPPEYCEFGGTTKKCEEWLKKNHKDLHHKIYEDAALVEGLTELSVQAQERADKDAAKKAAKAEAQESREAEKRAASKITIKRVERNKRKFVTTVQGLEAFGLDLKKTAKVLATKFATGSSVTKIPGGGEEITVQGDVCYEIEELLVEKYKDIPEDNIEVIEEKKKKAAG